MNRGRTYQTKVNRGNSMTMELLLKRRREEHALGDGTELLEQEKKSQLNDDDKEKNTYQGQINDPELIYALVETDRIKTLVESYEMGAALVGKFGGDTSDFGIPIVFTVRHKVDKDDLNGIAYKDMLVEIFQMDEMSAAQLVSDKLAKMPELWSWFPAVDHAPKAQRVIGSFDFYLQNLFRNNINKDAIPFMRFYLMNRNSENIDQSNAKEINDNLFKLNSLPDKYTLLLNFRVHSGKIAFNEPLDQKDKSLNQKNEEIIPDFNLNKPAYVDETYRETPVFYPRKLTLKEEIIGFAKNNHQITAITKKDLALTNVISQVLLSMIEDDELNKNTQTSTPQLYNSYLDFQEKTILESELYGELKIARGVYSKYYIISEQILIQSPEYHRILEMSAKSWSGPEGQTSYDAIYIWDHVLSKKINGAEFNELRNEYPEIPYGQYQFVQMYPGGVWHLSDREIVEMLKHRFLYDISNLSIESLSKKKNKANEISLTDQLSGMVVQLETIQKTKNAIERKLIGESFNGADAIPLPAVLIPKFENGQQAVQLSLYLLQEGPGEWKIIDFSIPTGKTPTYSGSGKDNKEAIIHALANFGQTATYPEGDIIAKGPKEYLGEENRIKVHSTGKNWKQDMAGNLSMISSIAGVLGLILVFTPLAPLGAGLLFVAGVTGASAGAIRISDRIEHETFELNDETMLDVIDIISGFIVVGKTASTAFKVVNQASKGSKMAVLVKGIETGADVASVVIIGNQFLQQLQDIQEQLNRKEIDETTYEQLRSEILQKAAAAGLLMLVGYAAPKITRRFGVSRNKPAQQEVSPAPEQSSTNKLPNQTQSKKKKNTISSKTKDTPKEPVKNADKTPDEVAAKIKSHEVDVENSKLEKSPVTDNKPENLDDLIANKVDLNSISQLKKAIRSMDEIGDLEKLKNTLAYLEKAHQLDPKVSQAILNAAEARKGYYAALKDFQRISRSTLNAGLNPELLDSLTRMAYHKIREGMANLDQFVIHIKQVWNKTDLTSEERELVDQAWKKGKEDVDNGIKYADEEIPETTELKSKENDKFEESSSLDKIKGAGNIVAELTEKSKNHMKYGDVTITVIDSRTTKPISEITRKITDPPISIPTKGVNISVDVSGIHFETILKTGLIEEIKRSPVTILSTGEQIYKSKIKVFIQEINNGQGGWKTIVKEKTWWPSSWSDEKVWAKISDAFSNKISIGVNKWEGVTSDGIKIEIYTDASGDITTAYIVP